MSSNQATDNNTKVDEQNIAHNTTQKAVSGGIWTVVFQVASMATRFGSNLIFAWMLAPEAFGVVALVNVFATGLLLFTDIGFEDSIVRSPRGDERRFRNTVWTMQIIRGVVLWLICMAFAYPLSQLYDEPQLMPLIAATAFALLFVGFQSTSLGYMRRHLQVITLAKLDLAAQVLGVIVGVIWAYYSPTAWALIVAMLTGWIVKMVVSHILDKQAGHDWFGWDWDAFHEIFKMGKWIFVSTMFMFLAMQSDRLFLGKLISIEMLGIYHVAISLAQIPELIVMQLSGKIIFPMLSHFAREDVDKVKHQLLGLRGNILPVALFMTLSLIVLAELFFGVLYKEAYHDAKWITPMLAGMFWISILQETVIRTSLAMGSFSVPAYTNIVAFFARIGLALLGFHFYELPGFIIGLILGSICGYGVVLTWLSRKNISTLRQDLGYTSLLLLVSGLYYGVRYLILPDILFWQVAWPLLVVAGMGAVFLIWGYSKYKAGKFSAA
ncbi:MAG: oligosaccharide flippase family protein [bacterium]